MKKTLVALAALAATGAYAQVTLSGIMDANYSVGTNYGDQSYSLISKNGARTSTFKFNGVEDMGKGLKAKFQFEVQPAFEANDGNSFNTTGGTGNAIPAVAAGAATTAAVAPGAAVANGTAQATGQASAQSGLVGKGYSYIGVEAPFGEVQFGTINSASLAAHGNGAGAWGTGIGSGYNVTVGSTGTNTFTRFENAIAYMTPTMNGFSGRVTFSPGNNSQYGTTTGVTLRRTQHTEFGGQYLTGPLQLNVAQLKSKTSPNEAAASATAAAGSNVTTTRTTLSVSYDLRVARLGYTRAMVENDAGLDSDNDSRKLKTTANMLYAQIPVGQFRFLLSTGNRTTNTGVDGAAAVSLAGKKTDIAGLGVEYDLSKRTYLYARTQSGTAADVAGSTTLINGAAANAGGTMTDAKYSLTAIGVSHAF